MAKFLYGFEHEAAFLTPTGDFADDSNTSYAEFQAIVDRLPLYEGDYPTLRVGDQKIKHKRWYVEGYERFDEAGNLIAFVPKGVETRILPQESIAAARRELEANFAPLRAAAEELGYAPAWASYNPLRSPVPLDPPLNVFEERRMQEYPEERTGYLTVRTFGPDINLSGGFSDAELVDIGRKLTYWSPYLVPWSYSSPFFEGRLWDGYSVRTYVRTGKRHAAKVFVGGPEVLLPGNPLVALARIPAERGRIEFKAFDSCPSFGLYASLMALIKGVALAELPGRADRPDTALHQRSAKAGWHDEEIATKAAQALEAARAALAGDPDAAYLERLNAMLTGKRMPADLLIDEFKRTGSIQETLKGSYDKFDL